MRNGTRTLINLSNPRNRLVAGAVAATIGSVVIAASVLNPVLATSAPKLADTAQSVSPLPGSFADLVAAIRPAVVNISTTGKVPFRDAPNMPQFRFPEGSPWEDFFERFFEDPRAHPRGEQPYRKARSLGSGFIIDAEGYVVTNHHVVDGADEITVILNDGKELAATLKGSDPKTDLALLKVEADEQLPYVEFGDSDGARVGDWVIAIGNPFGLGGSTSTGIISARGRDINAGPLDDFIQIDAPINRGNSGGPLFDTTGKVIGVNTAIFSPNGGNVGIGFAIPSTIAENVIDQLRADGVVQRGWLGVQIQAVTDDLAQGLGMEAARGALVSSVVPGSPADQAGVQAGDVILGYGGKPVDRVRDLPRLVAESKPGSRIAVEVWRRGGNQTLHASIKDSADDAVSLATTDDDRDSAPPRKLGLAVADMNPELRARFGLEADVEGVVVTAVEPTGPAAEQGLRPGDVITMVGQHKVTSAQQVVDAVNELSAQARGAVPLLITRDGRERFVAVRLA